MTEKKTFKDLKPSFILDQDNENESIYYPWCLKDSDRFFYTKSKFLPSENDRGYARIQSIWYADLITKHVKEIFPFCLYDLDYFEDSSNFFYFSATLVNEKNGFYSRSEELGKIFRMNKKSFNYESCFNTNSDFFHGFIAASDRFVIFEYEDHLPDNAIELIILDLENKQVVSIIDTELSYNFVKGQNSEFSYVLVKKWIDENQKSCNDNKLMCFYWTDFVSQLDWENF